MPNTHNVALNIRSCRESRGYSQDYMAEMLHICQSSYANIESGKTSLSIERLLQIAEILNADVYSLIENKKKMPIEKSMEEFSAQGIAHIIDVHDQAIKELKTEIEFIRKLVIEKLN